MGYETLEIREEDGIAWLTLNRPEQLNAYNVAMRDELFGVLADVGIYTTVVREISKEPERTEELVGNALVLEGEKDRTTNLRGEPLQETKA